MTSLLTVAVVPGRGRPVVAVAGSDGGRRVGGRITAATGTSASDRRSSLSSPEIARTSMSPKLAWNLITLRPRMPTLRLARRG
jgi:hypothetical protein